VSEGAQSTSLRAQAAILVLVACSLDRDGGMR